MALYQLTSRSAAVILILILTCSDQVQSRSSTTSTTTHQPPTTQPPKTRQCSINVIRDLGNKGPLPVSLMNNIIISPDKTGNVRLNPGESIDLYCSSNFESRSVNLLTVICVLHDKFIISGDRSEDEVRIETLKCSSSIRSVTKTVSSRPDGLTHVQIGFPISSSKFTSLIDIHMNITLLESLLVHHHVGQGITNGYKPESSRPSFRLDGIFPKDEIQTSYSKQNRTICNDILEVRLNSASCSRYFDTNNEKYLVKGHLAPMADFEYRAGQIASFSLANTVPQWQSINNGHWKKLESNIRILAKSADLDVFTGTLGRLQIDNNNGIKTDIHLHSSGKYPVPKFIYKIIVDQVNHRAVVVIGVNDPLSTEAEINDERLCPDQSSLIEWMDLKFKINSGSKKRPAQFMPIEELVHKGYLYACSIEPFLRNTSIEGLPDFVTQPTRRYTLLIRKAEEN